MYPAPPGPPGQIDYVNHTSSLIAPGQGDITAYYSIGSLDCALPVTRMGRRAVLAKDCVKETRARIRAAKSPIHCLAMPASVAICGKDHQDHQITIEQGHRWRVTGQTASGCLRS
jgi:hypothetical protein